MSGHHKNKGFSQTSKQYNGTLKAQQQQSRSKQMDHSADVYKTEEPSSSGSSMKMSGSGLQKKRA